MEIKTNEVDGVQIVDLIGKLDTVTSPEAEAKINELLTAGAQKMVLNLEGIDYLSSSGLRVFLGAAKKMMATGGKVVLCNPNSLVKEILHHSGFDTIIGVESSLEEAINSTRG